jgi:hypothetical protein
MLRMFIFVIMIYLFIYFNGKWGFYSWQWYYNFTSQRTIHTNCMQLGPTREATSCLATR